MSRVGEVETVKTRLAASGVAPKATGLVKLLGRAVSFVWASSRPMSIRLGVLTLVQALATVGQLAVIGRLVGQVQRLASASGEFSDAIPEIVAFGFLFILQGVASVWQNETRAVLGEMTTRHAQTEISRSATRAPLIDFDRPSFHDLLIRALRSGAARPLQVTSSISTIGTALVLVVALVITLVIIEPIVLGVLVLGGVPAWLLTRKVTQLGYRFAVEETEPDRRRSYLMYLLTNRQTAAELRAFQLADHVDERHHEQWTGRIDRMRTIAFQRGFFGSGGRIVNGVAITIIVAVLVWTVADGRSDLTAAATAAGAVAILGSRLNALLSGVGVLYECALFLSDVEQFSNLYPDPAPVDRVGAGQADPLESQPVGAGVLRAHDISFVYPTGSEPAVSNVSLEVETGQMIALVGANGSGKTTLAKVLAGLLSPSTGELSWNDHPIDIDDNVWHDSVSVVFQDFCKFMLPLRENVRYGRVDAPGGDAKIIEALDTVGLGSLPDSLPDGLSTGLGPEYMDSTDFSGGQWQRVAIARALFRDAPVVILDEPSAALDPDAEAQLFDAIAELCVGRAVVVISHRLATVTTADRIHVMRDGEIIESGTHGELMRADADYARMFRVQADRFADAADADEPDPSPVG